MNLKQIARVIFTKKSFFLSLSCLGIASALVLFVGYFLSGSSITIYLIRGFFHLAASLPLLPLFKTTDRLKFGFTFILVCLIFLPL